ncbi:uncharacterized protein BJ171DRAFT_190163 [Polychytrium aggregatum]|uniref:uncharacterized protein n=1 Tax=Polychytrium aggregatum TaxID=110093 RepID=UPI0022FE5766|nr:uncharacterized protein BJ171DRAFT_190163 [Polychytrium aggregatum]KAI9202046.1 hypothetical protein BJ171DRAFT_190163 [Polychytrium aggregatum]
MVTFASLRLLSSAASFAGHRPLPLPPPSLCVASPRPAAAEGRQRPLHIHPTTIPHLPPGPSCFSVAGPQALGHHTTHLPVRLMCPRPDT